MLDFWCWHANCSLKVQTRFKEAFIMLQKSKTDVDVLGAPISERIIALKAKPKDISNENDQVLFIQAIVTRNILGNYKYIR